MILQCWGQVRLHFAVEDNFEGLILNLQNVYYIWNNLCNLIILGLLNESKIYYNNKRKTLYYISSRKVLVQIAYWKNSYLLKPLNHFDGAVRLLKIKDNNN